MNETTYCDNCGDPLDEAGYVAWFFGPATASTNEGESAMACPPCAIDRLPAGCLDSLAAMVREAVKVQTLLPHSPQDLLAPGAIRMWADRGVVHLHTVTEDADIHLSSASSIVQPQ